MPKKKPVARKPLPRLASSEVVALEKEVFAFLADVHKRAKEFRALLQKAQTDSHKQHNKQWGATFEKLRVEQRHAYGDEFQRLSRIAARYSDILESAPYGFEPGDETLIDALCQLAYYTKPKDVAQHAKTVLWHEGKVREQMAADEGAAEAKPAIKPPRMKRGSK